jgi:hypothetical protein
MHTGVLATSMLSMAGISVLTFFKKRFLNKNKEQLNYSSVGRISPAFRFKLLREKLRKLFAAIRAN